MHEITLTPAHLLKQSVDYPITINYSADVGITASDTARMDIRRTLCGDVIDTLTTENERIVISAHPDGSATVTINLTGEASRNYPVKDAKGKTCYEPLDSNYPDENPVLKAGGTLIITSAEGQDRIRATLDFQLLFEASYTRGTP